MNLNYIPILSTLVTFIFAFSVLNRWRSKKPKHLLFWGIGLLLYGLGTLCEVVFAFRFSELALRLWYLSGAMLTAAWLGQGTVFLLVRKRWIANGLAVALILLSLAAFFLVFTAPLTGAQATYAVDGKISEQYKEILVRNGWMIFLTVLFNLYGTVTLVGGAIYSSFIFWRKHVLVNRMIGNLLIAVGALFPAIAGSLLQRGTLDILYLSELIGVILMYAGFLKATSTPVEVLKIAEPAPAN